MTKVPQLWFHDSFILKFNKVDSCINLELARAVDKNENNYHVFIKLEDVKKIESDADINASELMPTTNGEILTLDLKDHRVELIALWVDFNTRESFVKYYYIDCEGILIEAHPIEALTERRQGNSPSTGTDEFPYPSRGASCDARSP